MPASVFFALMAFRTLTSHQKIGTTIVAAISVVTFVFGVVRIRGMIRNPFARAGTGTFVTEEEQQQQKNDALKQKDTDGDGLNDYEELSVYKTSPYLPDSDSDGVNDGIEVKQGTDPNCPQGKVCRQEKVAPAPAPVATADTSPTASADQQQQAQALLATLSATLGDISQMSTQQFTDKVQTLSSSQLQSLIVSIGVPQEMVSKTDDATLRKLLVDAFVSTQTQTSASTTSSALPPQPKK